MIAGLQTPKCEAGSENDKKAFTNLEYQQLLLRERAFEQRPGWTTATCLKLRNPPTVEVPLLLPMVVDDRLIECTTPARRTTRVPHGPKGHGASNPWT